jgi:hypothetical protein
MQQINKNSAGLAVGVFFSLAHLGWTILVALKLAKPLMDWILHLHMMELSYTIQPFALGTAVLLVIVTFVVGFVLGWVITALWNAFVK